MWHDLPNPKGLRQWSGCSIHGHVVSSQLRGHLQDLKMQGDDGEIPVIQRGHGQGWVQQLLPA
jgi:hypothetical protein